MVSDQLPYKDIVDGLCYEDKLSDNVRRAAFACISIIPSAFSKALLVYSYVMQVGVNISLYKAQIYYVQLPDDKEIEYQLSPLMSQIPPMKWHRLLIVEQQSKSTPFLTSEFILSPFSCRMHCLLFT